MRPAAVRHPEQQHRAPGARPRSTTRSTRTQSLFARYFYAVYDNPATYDGSNALTLSRTGQNNQVHSLVVGHNRVLSSSTLNSLHVTFNRRSTIGRCREYFTRDRSRLARSSAWCRATSASASPATASSIGTGGTNPGLLQLERLPDRRRPRPGARHAPALVRRQLDPLAHRDAQQPADQRRSSRSTARAPASSLADFMLGVVSGGFLQGNPVYDYDHSDYVGAYAQDNWRVAAEPDGQPRPALGAVPAGEEHRLAGSATSTQARFDQNVHSTVYPQAPAGPDVPRRRRLSRATRRRSSKMAQFAPRVGVVWTPNGDERTSVRASWGVFYDTPHLFFNTRFANNPPWGAQITLTNPPGGFADPYLGYPGGNPFPALEHRLGRRSRSRRSASTSTRRSTPQPTSLQQWNVSVQRQFGDWLLTGELSRQPLEPSVARDRAELRRSSAPGATTGNDQRAPRARAAEPGAGAVLRHDRPARRHRPRQLQRACCCRLQRRLKSNLSVLVELHALQVHERSGDDRDHRADDRRSDQPGSRLLVLRVRSPPRRQRLARRADAGRSRTHALRAIFSDWQFVADRPLAERQPFERHDRRRQRADRHGRPARRADSRRPVRRRRP